MLQGKNIKIFQITGKKPNSYNSIEFTVHKPIPYLQTTANKMLVANQLPFSNCKVGDKLAVNVDRTSLRFPTIQGKIYNDSEVAVKVSSQGSLYSFL
jgi:hypothetical protein